MAFQDLSIPTVRLSSRYGQMYQCSYQQKDSKREEEEKIALETGVLELLKPMSDAPCLVQVKK